MLITPPPPKKKALDHSYLWRDVFGHVAEPKAGDPLILWRFQFGHLILPIEHLRSHGVVLAIEAIANVLMGQWVGPVRGHLMPESRIESHNLHISPPWSMTL